MALDNDDIARLSEIFITRRECDTRTTSIKEDLSNDATKLALIEAKLNTIAWVSKTTLGAVIVAIVGVVLKLILK